MAKALFPMGSLYITPGALAACASFPMAPTILLIRHATGDWSEMDAEDQESNHRAIRVGARILSLYRYDTTQFYVITQADGASTTILLRDEY